MPTFNVLPEPFALLLAELMVTRFCLVPRTPWGRFPWLQPKISQTARLAWSRCPRSLLEVKALFNPQWQSHGKRHLHSKWAGVCMCVLEGRTMFAWLLFQFNLWAFIASPANKICVLFSFEFLFILNRIICKITPLVWMRLHFGSRCIGDPTFVTNSFLDVRRI